MLAGSCTQPYHLYKARLAPIIMPTLDADGWIWPIFVGSKKCDCKVMLCASSCLMHIGSVIWLDKLFKHLSNPTFQARFCFSLYSSGSGRVTAALLKTHSVCMPNREDFLIMQTTCTILQKSHNGALSKMVLIAIMPVRKSYIEIPFRTQ